MSYASVLLELFPMTRGLEGGQLNGSWVNQLRVSGDSTNCKFQWSQRRPLEPSDPRKALVSYWPHDSLPRKKKKKKEVVTLVTFPK